MKTGELYQMMVIYYIQQSYSNAYSLLSSHVHVREKVKKNGVLYIVRKRDGKRTRVELAGPNCGINIFPARDRVSTGYPVVHWSAVDVAGPNGRPGRPAGTKSAW